MNDKRQHIEERIAEVLQDLALAQKMQAVFNAAGPDLMEVLGVFKAKAEATMLDLNAESFASPQGFLLAHTGMRGARTVVAKMSQEFARSSETVLQLRRAHQELEQALKGLTKSAERSASGNLE